MCAYMQNICSETCAKCVRKDYLSCICVQMLRISRYLLVRGADSANFEEIVGKLRKFWLIHSNFPGFSVDGRRSETSEL